MTDKLYSIVFKKEIETGRDVGTVKSNLTALFKTDETTIEKMFQRDSVVIKKGLTEAHAKKYRDALQKAGAIVYAVEEGHKEIEVVDPMEEGPKAIEATTSASWSSLVELQEFVPLEFDTDEYVLAPEGEQLIAEQVVKKPEYGFEGMDLAPVGEALVEEPEFVPAQFDTEGMTLIES